MYLDDHFTYARNTAAFGAATTKLVGVAKPGEGSYNRIGVVGEAYLVISVSQAFVGAGTIQFSFRTAATDAGVPAGAIVAQTGTYTIAELNAAGKIIMPIPSTPGGILEWAGVTMTSSGATTAGAINAFFTLDAQNWYAVPANSGIA